MNSPTLEPLLPEALRFLQDLVSTNSYTLNAAGVDANAARIIEQFAPFGFTARQVPCAEPGTGSHLVLDSGGEGPVVACVSHLDTVFTPEEEAANAFHWQPEGGRIYGPGTYDIKGGTVALWLLLRALAEHAPEALRSVRWVLIWNAAEEILTPSFEAFARSLLPAEVGAYLVFEGDSGPAGSAEYRILRARKGRGIFTVKVAGRGAHAGSKYREGANAIAQLCQLVESAVGLTDLDEEVTVNVGTIRGGSVVNRVPHEAEASFEVRTYDTEPYEAVREAFLAMEGEGEVAAVSDGFPCTISVEVKGEIPAWARNERTEWLAGFWQEAARETGTSFALTERGGLSDGNWFWREWPVLDGLGPRGGNAHASERSADGSKEPEFVDATSFIPKTVLNFHAVRALVEALRTKR